MYYAGLEVERFRHGISVEFYLGKRAVQINYFAAAEGFMLDRDTNLHQSFKIFFVIFRQKSAVFRAFSARKASVLCRF